MLAGAIGIGMVAAGLPTWSEAAAVAGAPVAVVAGAAGAGAPPVAGDAAVPAAQAPAPAVPAAAADVPAAAADVPAAAGDVPAAGAHGHDPIAPEDPLVGFNRFSYKISQPIDRFIFRPVAMAYYHFVPGPVRDGARNFLDNLYMSQVLANDILQLRPKRVVHTVARFLINTTLGIGGIFDIAKRKPFHLPAHPNSLGDTLGYYGVRPGPYVYLPIVGPSTFRDLVGSVGDAFTQPLVLNSVTDSETFETRHHHIRTRATSAYTLTTYGVAAFIVGGLDKRSRVDGELQALKAQSVDPYAAMRSAFLQDRAGEIAALKAHGNGVPGDAGALTGVPAFDDPLDDPAATGAQPAPAAAPEIKPKG